MTCKSASPEAILKIVEDSLSLLGPTPDVSQGRTLSSEPLPSLYQQCLEIVENSRARRTAPIRTIHHFACTGGTLISKHLAVSPNTRLLSEIDPLSPIVKLHFSPTDLILQLRSGLRATDPALQEDIFLGGLRVLYDYAGSVGERLILRDHTHSHFCTGPEIPQRRSLRQMVASQFETVSAVTVRHPLDSFLSLDRNGWHHFTPFTLDEYARRYMAFLDHYADLEIFTYEDFVALPEETLHGLCARLQLPFDPDLTDIAAELQMTGDSGRHSRRIEPRAARPIPEATKKALSDSPHYDALCVRLGYDPARP